LLGAAAGAWAAGDDPGDCVTGGEGRPTRCLYRSLLPSTGIVADCESDTRCRVGAYYGSPDAPIPFATPPGWDALPRPKVYWHGATFAEVRFVSGAGAQVSYFFEARRRRISPARAEVLGVDARRWLVARAAGRIIEVVQIFGGRPVARIERPWAPGLSVREAITAMHFDADGRLTFTWLAGTERRPTTERVTVPSIPLSS
jgi:hypothetical protein